MVVQPGRMIGHSKDLSNEAIKEMREATEELLSVRRVVPIFVDTGVIQRTPSNKVQLYIESLAVSVVRIMYGLTACIWCPGSLC